MRVFETYQALQAALDLEADKPGAFRFLEAFAPAGFRCADCGEAKPFPMKGGGTGYGVRRDDNGAESMSCYACCSERERADMLATGQGVLYLTGIRVFGMDPKPGEAMRVTDWPGGLSFPVMSHWTGRHNFGGRVNFVRFIGPDGGEWSGRNVGDSQICRVRRIKPQRGGPVSVTFNHDQSQDREAVLERFRSIADAEAWLDRVAGGRNPTGLERGDYSICAPESLVNPPAGKGRAA